jgi:hypothetical protein
MQRISADIASALGCDADQTRVRIESGDLDQGDLEGTRPICELESLAGRLLTAQEQGGMYVANLLLLPASPAFGKTRSNGAV